ncbi:hypothetical protein B0H14DRAFT_2627539 [Mycena olivaceomarginata]|nr:hypothetical protein B0H14DRAFT_2627539 [Mycena olivaceomarginata]
MASKTHYQTRLTERLSRTGQFSPTPESPAQSRQRTSSKNQCAASEEVEPEDATGSDFDPDQKASSPDSDEEFPSSLPLPSAEAPMDVDEEPESSRRARRPTSASSRGKSSPAKAASKTVARVQSSDESRTSQSPTPDDSIELDLGEHKLPNWALPAHLPKFRIRSDPLNPSPVRHVTFRLFTDVEVMETVFNNPAYKISETGKWLEHIAHGDKSVRRYCRIFNDLWIRLPVFLFRFPAARDPPEIPDDPNHPIFTPSEPKPERPVFVSRSLDLPDPAVGTSLFQEFQKIYTQNAETRALHEADEMARFAQLESDHQAALEKWEVMAAEYRSNVPVVRAEQVEVLRLYRACREDIIDRMEREANTVGKYAYHVTSHALSRPTNARATLSRTPVASSASVPNPSIPSKRGHEEIDDVPTPPISDSDEERLSSLTRVGPPGKGKVKARSLSSTRGSRVESSNTSRVPPGAALSARPEMSSAGSFLGAGAAAAGPSTTDEGTSFAEGGPSLSQQEASFDVDAWHKAHNPFTQPPFQQEVVLNANGTKAVVSHGWQLDPVNPCFLAHLASYGVLGSQMPSWAVVSRAKGCKDCHKNGGACVRLVLSGAPPVTSCQRCRMKNRTCVASTSGFDFTVTDHIISIMNAELVDMYTDAILSSLTPLTGIDVVSRIMSRVIVHRQDARLREGCAPRADLLNVEVPLERRVDVLVCPGAGRQEFLKRSFVPFQGAQYGDRRHRLPLPDRQSPIDATMYLMHMLEDVVDRISAGAQLVLPEDFEVGDHPLDFGGFLTAGEVGQLPQHPPILPSESKLSEFPSLYHFRGEARARLEEKYPGGVAYRHADGRVTGPLVTGGFDTSEDNSTREDHLIGSD